MRGAAAAITALAALSGIAALGPAAYANWRPANAARLAPWDNFVLRGAAQAQLQSGNAQSASSLGAAAVRAMPFDQFALAASTIGQNDARRLAALNTVAGLGWRDTVSNLALIRESLAVGEVEIAAARIDALGRTSGAQFAAPYADRLLELPRGSRGLAMRAEHRSGDAWWEGWLRMQPPSRAAAERRATLVKLFPKDDPVWLRNSVANAAIGFGKAGLDDLSIALWRETLADSAHFSGFLYDGDFRLLDLSRRPLGSEWHIASIPDVGIDVRTNGGIVIAGSEQASGTILTQNLALAPARYRLTGKWHNPDGALGWEIHCKGGRRIAENSLSGSRKNDIDLSFGIVPDCLVVALILKLQPRRQAAHGTASVGSLYLERIL